MSSQHALLKVLADGKYHSGTDLGVQFDISRAAIYKNIQKLENNFGLKVFAVKGKGYRLQRPLELFDKEIILKYLTELTLSQLNQLDVFIDIDSTNRYLMNKSIESVASAVLVLAEQQTSGQGRRGRSWISPFGCNLYLSLLWQFQSGPAQLGCLGLVVAVAIVRVLHRLGVKDAGVKWPNDIVWNGKKLGGILLEMRGEANGPSTVVIGIGINISMPRDKVEELDGIDQPWIDIETILQAKVQRNHFAALIIDALFELLNKVPEQQQILLDEWRQMDVLKDRDITVQFADKVIEGKVLGINPDGALRILQNGKEVICHSAEVSLRRGE